eukprot:TRINITY_DN2351_c0_g1_i2.p1 TRINITY_DN2351_c0_g1~~TRINITY_DN2351_c0_g1_i2.p1  ORF type:complete len:280 (+),score=87.57 TRINITY_DN2351_c0_g1_i2:560-1399(+)
MVFNVVEADLTSPNIVVTPAFADPKTQYQLQTLPDMAKRVPNAIAGINGGYFWRLDKSTFIDDVCILKSRYDAQQPPSLSQPDYGVSDSLLIINGTLYGTNCNLPGYEVPVALVINGTSSNFQILSMGQQLDPKVVKNAIAAGPNLVSLDTSGSTPSPYVNIPWDDFNVNIWEHAANTAVGLKSSSGSVSKVDRIVLVTADGDDNCASSDPSCGIEAEPMAYYMKDFIKADWAMEMDQGGSTTMWIAGQPNNGVVSNSASLGPPGSPRPLFDGLFIAFK